MDAFLNMTSERNIQIIAAPSILGLRPTGVQNLAGTLLSNGLREGIASRTTPIHIPTLNQLYTKNRYDDRSVANEAQLGEFLKSLYTTVLSVSIQNFQLILGGDCSILIGVMAALKSLGQYGLLFLDAHEDFYLPHQSQTGEAADMDLAIVTGRGPTSLTDIHGLRPYVKDEHVWHIGQRDQEEVKKFGSQTIHDTDIHRFGYPLFQNQPHQRICETIVDSAVHTTGLDGYWIHFDADVLSDAQNPAVDYRLPGGLTFEQTVYLLRQFVETLPVVGMTVTIYNPALDPGGDIARALTKSLITVFR